MTFPLFILLILAGFAFFRARSNTRRIDQMAGALRQLSGQFADLSQKFAALQKAAGLSDAVVDAPTAAPETAAPAQEPPFEGIVLTDFETPKTTGDAALFASSSAAPTPAPTRSLEETLTSNWLVWVGGFSIALAGAFLVKYAVDNELLGPVARISLGLALGIVLAIAGEWLRQRPLQRAIAAIRVNYVPPALTAAGLFIAFASIYSAYAVYGLLPPLVAFAALALIALLAVGLSLLQGRFVALMGLLGAFVAPAMVVAPNPSAWGLFSYLAFVEAACLAVARYQSWWWMASVTLAGVVVWPLLWVGDTHWKQTDALPLGLYLLLTVAGYFLVRRGRQIRDGHEHWFEEISELELPEWTSWAAATATALVLFFVVHAADYSVTGLVFAGLVSALYIFVGRREPVFDALAPGAGILVLAIAATMPLPASVDAPTGLPGAALIPSELQYYAGANVVFGVLFGVSGFAALWGARRPALWAGTSVLVPILLLVIAYYRITDFGADLAWSAAALALAGLSLFAASRVERYRTADGLEVTLGIYAAAVVALISIAAAMILREAWLTVALSIQLPALAWINKRIQTGSIQIIAAAVAGIVLFRLALNYNILSYRVTASPLTSWVVYGYGIPALAFFVAARLFRKLGAGPVVTLLYSGALVFVVLLVSLEIRLFVDGSLQTTKYGLLEASLQSISWLAIGTALAFHDRREPNVVSTYGSRILLGAAAAQIVFVQLLTSNPLSTHEYVGAYPLLNVLLLAYAVPAVFAFLFAFTLRETQSEVSSYVAVAGFALLFVYLTLEIARSFQGPVLFGIGRTDAEVYTYSVAWLAYALALLGLGIFLSQKLLRYVSLAVLVITAGKVFLFDMAGLMGLYRVASFLGLGLSLVGIGYLYQRFVFAPPTPATPPNAPEPHAS